MKMAGLLFSMARNSAMSRAVPSMRNEIRDGVRDAVPILFAIFVFGLVFGAIAVEKGFSPLEAGWFSVIVYAGASQMAAVDLFDQQVPYWSIVLTVLAVNFRFTLYSAAMHRNMAAFAGWQKYLAMAFMVDPNFALADQRARAGQLRPAYYFSLSLMMYFSWQLVTVIGAWFGALIENPDRWGLDFFLPVYFMALLMGFRARPNWLAIVVGSSAVSIPVYFLLGTPWHISAGAVAGILVGAVMAKPPHDPDQGAEGAQ